MRRAVICVRRRQSVNDPARIPAHFRQSGRERFRVIFLDDPGRSDIIAELAAYHSCTSFVSRALLRPRLVPVTYRVKPRRWKLG